ncbi:MAG: MoxR family ATPase [Bacillota bacterium]|nr:MoxR family ATPase [Bacillota bacterium]
MNSNSLVVTSVAELQEKFYQQEYLLEEKIATIIFLAVNLDRPVLIEGPPGVGKTELAKKFAKAYSHSFYRLQCYEGLDESKALYEWDYQKQLLFIQALAKDKENWDKLKGKIYSQEFLLPRPLLSSIMSSEKATLLIDEIDKSDEEFEALLLELLSEYTVTIPEFKTVEAKTKPAVFITSNGTRQLSEPLKRRCVHVYLEYPKAERELEILKLKCPQLNLQLAKEIIAFSNSLRQQDLHRPPSIAEVIDWSKALILLGVGALSKQTIADTISFILKHNDDANKILNKLNILLA